MIAERRASARPRARAHRRQRDALGALEHQRGARLDPAPLRLRRRGQPAHDARDSDRDRRGSGGRSTSAGRSSASPSRASDARPARARRTPRTSSARMSSARTSAARSGESSIGVEAGDQSGYRRLAQVDPQTAQRLAAAGVSADRIGLAEGGVGSLVSAASIYGSSDNVPPGYGYYDGYYDHRPGTSASAPGTRATGAAAGASASATATRTAGRPGATPGGGRPPTA